MNITVLLEFEDAGPLFLGDVSALLNDLGLSYDLGVLLTDPDYKDYRFNRFFWFRNSHRIRVDRRMRVKRISRESPLVLEVVATSIGGVWILIQIVERVRNWSLSREKLELEVDKLRREQRAYRESVIREYQDQLDSLFDDRDSTSIEERLTRRLSKSPLKLRRLEVKIVDNEIKER